MVLVYAHRGASAELPENTLEAFLRAIERGADILETDVHCTADGHVVIHHDATGERMSQVSRAVADTPLAEVRKWNAGAGFRQNGAGRATFRVPTLEEALDAFPEMRFNIDIKARAAITGTIDAIRNVDAEPSVLLTSFHDDVVQSIRRRGYRGPTGLSRNESLRVLGLPRWAPQRYRPAGDRLQIPVKVGPLRLDRRAQIERFKQLGYAVDYWVVNDPRLACALGEAGADGVMTDDPRVVVPALRPAASRDRASV